ncbi:hypothetical protein EVAR_45810_1 [Eumeta japonica]|uniref:Uncharacterized protein n=1 Tax=Eumeta variegata TaxID=151549 RepID=A0A4C1X3X6_EUMVA|nr:hypothetical protein EVAR_45810_1 [Eumeta japonica]
MLLTTGPSPQSKQYETENRIDSTGRTDNKTMVSLLTYSSDFGAAPLDPCELRTAVPYTYTLSERSAELHGRRSGGIRCAKVRNAVRTQVYKCVSAACDEVFDRMKLVPGQPNFAGEQFAMGI